MPENLRKQRKQPLDFTRDFVASNAGMEAAKFQEQAAQLGNGDGMRHAMLLGLFRELVNRASNQDRAWRGYLIDAERRPLTLGQLAKSLRWPSAELKKALKELATTGLIERVPEPDYVADDEREFPPEATEKPTKQRRRKSTERDGRSGKPSRTGNGQVPCPKDKRVKGARSNDRSAIEAKSESEGQREEQPGCKASLSPATTPSPEPADPKEPELGQGRTARIATGPARSAKSSMRPDAVPLGHVVKIQDWDAERFGLEVFEALGLDKCFAPNSTEGKSERVSFANWLVKAKANAPTAWPELRERGIRKAQHIAKHGRSAKRPGAVWHKIMGRQVGQSKSKTA